MEEHYSFGIDNKWVRRILIASAYTLLLTAPYIIKKKIEQQQSERARYEVLDNQNRGIEQNSGNNKENQTLENKLEEVK